MNIRMSVLFLFSKLKEEDKIKHLEWSFWIALTALTVVSDIYAFLFAFFIGVVKEVWDRYYGSGFCLYDILANCIGIFLAFAIKSIFILGFSFL